MSNEFEMQSNFIYNMILNDVKEGKHGGRVHTRFPPEPNGYLHIGHVKAALLNYNLARAFDGQFNLRFDDTNPVKEEEEFVDSIMEDLRWLGIEWEDRLFFSSDSFETKYEFAKRLVEAGRAYVCDLNTEQIREYRGTLTEPGEESPYRDRSIEESLDLFQRMRQGEFSNGARVLRAKIDMSSGNLNMRDPVIYRILHADHHRTGDKWCIYPMYDFDHPFTDALEGITHSLCSIEYSDHRPLYDWVVDNALDLMPEIMKCRSEQTEFARLNITHMVLSKRKLRRLVEEGHVQGWDDPRMPTVAGLRRRGFTAKAICDFQERVGVARSDSVVDLAMLTFCIRNDLESKAPRRMVVLDPLKLVITNWPEDKTEMVELDNIPGDATAGTRKVPFGRQIYIEQEDFMEDPPKKFYRLAPGREVRLMRAYAVTCEEVIKDPDGNVIELRCTYDPKTQSGNDTSGRKIRGTLHWVAARNAARIDVRLYDNLFLEEDPEGEDDGDFTGALNPDSLRVLTNVPAEPAITDVAEGGRLQFMRKGYFYVDPHDKDKDRLTFNRIAALKDTWAKIKKRK